LSPCETHDLCAQSMGFAKRSTHPTTCCRNCRGPISGLVRRVARVSRDVMTMTETLKASLARLPVTLRDIEAAASVLAGFVTRTSFERSRTLSDITGASVWLKFENL